MNPTNFVTRRVQLRATLCLLAIIAFAPLFSLDSEAQQNETPQQYVNRLVREATGAQPVRESRFPRQRALENALRTQFRERIEGNRAFMAAANKVDQNKIKKLMTQESLADPVTAADAVRELEAYSALEQEHSAQADQSMIKLRHTFETGDWPPAQRAGLLKSFDAIMAEPEEGRHGYIQAAKSWVDAVDDLYRYTTAHQSVLKIEGGELRVYDDKVMDELNEKIRLANSRGEEMVNAQQAYTALQNKRLKSVGVDPKAVGLK